MNHFSKFLISDGKTTATHLKNCFKDYGEPEQIGSDNGSEFTNKNVTNLLNAENIDLILGKPYNPHSQGTVERVHRTVRNALVCKYLENKEKFNLVNSLNEVVTIYNSMRHRTTKYKTITIFNCEDESFIQKVFENTINSSKNYYSDLSLFKPNDTVLLFNNIDLTYVKKNNI